MVFFFNVLGLQLRYRLLSIRQLCLQATTRKVTFKCASYTYTINYFTFSACVLLQDPRISNYQSPRYMTSAPPAPPNQPPPPPPVSVMAPQAQVNRTSSVSQYGYDPHRQSMGGESHIMKEYTQPLHNYCDRFPL